MFSLISVLVSLVAIVIAAMANARSKRALRQIAEQEAKRLLLTSKHEQLAFQVLAQKKAQARTEADQV